MGKIAVQIITDSASDIEKEMQARWGISIVPLTVQFSDKSYLDGVTISKAEFYEKLESEAELPKTSMVPPSDFEEIFQKALEVGDDVVGIFLSGELSGTFQSACIAKENLNSDRIFLLDSLSASLGLMLLVQEAVHLRDAGCEAQEIMDKISPLPQKICLLAAVDTLKYLRKGGRISAGSAMVGEMLGIKPMITIRDGRVESIGKARGMNAAMKHLLQEALKAEMDSSYSIVFAHSATPQLMEKTIETVKEPMELTNWLTCQVGSTIGTHVGRGCVGLAFIRK